MTARLRSVLWSLLGLVVAAPIGVYVAQEIAIGGSSVITVANFASVGGLGAVDRRFAYVVDDEGTVYPVVGARYYGQSADDIWRLMKIGCRYRISTFRFAPDAKSKQDALAISGAEMLNCPLT